MVVVVAAAAAAVVATILTAAALQFPPWRADLSSPLLLLLVLFVLYSFS